MIVDNRYPIGKYTPPVQITSENIHLWVNEIEALPNLLRETLKNATDNQLNTPYREGGWTVRQVVNHLADSHLNSFTRFKLALTEENPTIRPYYENLWAELSDGKDTPIEWSLSILEGLHGRWAYLMKNMSPSDWQKTFFHPEHKNNMPLDVTCGMYAWHGKHHLAHINLGMTEK